MKEILERNSEAVREAGRQLVEIGAELAAGKIDDALARLDTPGRLTPSVRSSIKPRLISKG